MKSSVKTYAKINLTLNVTGSENGYHSLDSIVSSIDLFDEITVKKNKIDAVRLKMTGIDVDYTISEKDNNAYKAGILFKETFSTCGFDITVKKGIPFGGGLGGSSADVSGTLVALKNLFNIQADVKPLADKLGSDSGFMLYGGTARLKGRGDKVHNLKHFKFYAVIILANSGVDTTACFKKFDELNANGILSDNDKVETAIESGDIYKVCEEVANALTMPSETINGEVKKNLDALRSLSPLCASMTGSGSTVFGIFETEELCRYAKDKLRAQGYDAYVIKSVLP